jgi:hypothetical protein
MSSLVAASRPIISFLRPHSLRLIGFQADLLLLQQCQKYEVHILVSLALLAYSDEN